MPFEKKLPREAYRETIGERSYLPSSRLAAAIAESILAKADSLQAQRYYCGIGARIVASEHGL